MAPPNYIFLYRIWIQIEDGVEDEILCKNMREVDREIFELKKARWMYGHQSILSAHLIDNKEDEIIREIPRDF